MFNWPVCIRVEYRVVRIDADVYDRIEARKRDEETFSEALERLLAAPSLLHLAGVLNDDAGAFEAAIDETGADYEADLDDVVDEFR